jgi:MFS family permease
MHATSSARPHNVAELTRESETIPSLLDRLPWSSWHLRIVFALGITWLLDGLEGSLGGSLAGALKQSRQSGGLGFTDAQLGLSSSCYLAGAVAGALLFGYMADRYGRRRLFFWTLSLYVCATAATGFSRGLWGFTFCRVLTGAGIGGEYAAINSAVDELMPARLRGRIDLWINGTFWLGIILGSGVTVSLLSRPVIMGFASWRLAFCTGLPIATMVLFMRRFIPESPRWLLAHGKPQQAEKAWLEIASSIPGLMAGRVFTHEEPAYAGESLLRTVLSPRFRRRTLLCLILMMAQAFFYNSVFFSLSLVLLRFYGAQTDRVGSYFIPIAIANFLGPILLGHFFDTVGRRKMIGSTYCLAAGALLLSSILFLSGRLDLHSQVLIWAVVFFFASAAASSAYLTISEVFPQKVRASAIALFYAIATLAGGVFGPFVFGRLIGSGQRGALFVGYLIGAAGMALAGLAAFAWVLDAEGRSLEDLTLS